MMKRLVVVIDPEGGSQKLFVKCLYHYKNHLKEALETDHEGFESLQY